MGTLGMTPGTYYTISSFVQLAVFLAIYLGEHRRTKRASKEIAFIVRALERIEGERKAIARAIKELANMVEEKGM